MSQPLPTSRRQFLRQGAQAAALITLAHRTQAAEGPPRLSPGPVHHLDLRQPRSVATDGARHLLVAGDREVLLLDAEGRLERRMETGRPVRAAAFLPSNRLVLAFKEHLEVWSRAGERQASWSTLGRNAILTSLAVTREGEVFASDTGDKVIWRFDAQGHQLGRVERAGGSFLPAQAFFPIAWQDDKLWVADPGRHEVLALDREGRQLASWGHRSRGEDGFGGCCNPVAMTPMPGGRVLTAERGRPRLKAFTFSGHFERQIAGPELFAANAEAASAADADLFGCQGGGFDLATGDQGRVWVLDRATAELRVWLPA